MPLIHHGIPRNAKNDAVRDALRLEVRRQEDVVRLKRIELTNLQQTKIHRLEYALQIAQAAGISRPVYSNGQGIKDDPDFSVMLGSQGLSRKLQIEKALNNIAELNVDLRNQEYRLTMLKQIIVPDLSFPVVNFLQPATLPVKKEGPDSLMIVLLAALTGLTAGAGQHLLQQAWQKQKESHA
ncbi:hypothetical protein [Enterobacter sp. DC4]|uniref:hypothetical protein n=1 Tax=Enterobacter sp. DC4 TaxID=1395580 RepID=UPI0004AE6771|nr:hypothetical protein [Enterobacter sp. DC4]